MHATLSLSTVMQSTTHAMLLLARSRGISFARHERKEESKFTQRTLCKAKIQKLTPRDSKRESKCRSSSALHLSPWFGSVRGFSLHAIEVRWSPGFWAARWAPQFWFVAQS